MTTSEEMLLSISEFPFTYRDKLVLVTLSSVSVSGDMLVVSELFCSYDDQIVDIANILDMPLIYGNPPRFVDGAEDPGLAMQRMIADSVRHAIGKV